MKHEYHEGPKAGENFEQLARAVFQAPRVAVSKKQPKVKPKRRKTAGCNTMGKYVRQPFYCPYESVNPFHGDSARLFCRLIQIWVRRSSSRSFLSGHEEQTIILAKLLEIACLNKSKYLGTKFFSCAVNQPI
jgi:hypothetical protein